MSEAKESRAFRLRLVKEFLDYVILIYLKRQGKVAGYDLIRQINNDYGVLLSPGTIYSKLYSLERRGLIKGQWMEKKREFVLTQQGRKNIDAIMKDPLAKNFLALIERVSKE